MILLNLYEQKYRKLIEVYIKQYPTITTIPSYLKENKNQNIILEKTN